MKEVKFKDLRLGDFLHVPFLKQDIYITGLDYENQTFEYSSLTWLPRNLSTMPRILIENKQFFLVGIAVPAKHSWFKRHFLKEFLHDVQLQEFSTTEKRILELHELN